MAHTSLHEIFWDVAPYVSLSIAGFGTWWRYRYDKFGWTSRSSQLYESRLLQIGSPLFHFGSLMVIMGHVMGLCIPEWLTEDIGLSDHFYHLQALVLGAPAGLATLIGVGLLIYRRRTRAPVRLATSLSDKLMYLVLVCALVAGMGCTLMGATHYGEVHDYRQNVSVWFRSIFILDPRGDLMMQARSTSRCTRRSHCCCLPYGLSPAWCTHLAPDRISVPALHRLPQPRGGNRREIGRVSAPAPGW
ncbi:respiratory nitrate reductase, gamma subunit [Mycobacterium xenopi 4042]|uniref:Nitrate reductase-like protein NarX n=1 Tax=Mycobacterium xenopi 4042 TaxID=1299334 RepID=X8DZ13_MYCXE|nr:respiratory nitrate reductase, gamma subunit [Mycobacterium xenopi 4042]